VFCEPSWQTNETQGRDYEGGGGEGGGGGKRHGRRGKRRRRKRRRSWRMERRKR
jgi:hypothetical protein